MDISRQKLQSTIAESTWSKEKKCIVCPCECVLWSVMNVPLQTAVGALLLTMPTSFISASAVGQGKMKTNSRDNRINQSTFVPKATCDGNLTKDCMGFSYDNCVFPTDQSLIEQVHQTDLDNCQFLCSVIYTGTCLEFIYDKGQLTCSLYSVPFDPSTQCQRAGGPKSVSRVDCSDQECMVRTNT